MSSTAPILSAHRASGGSSSSNQMMDIENLNDEELNVIQARHEKISTEYLERKTGRKS